MSDPSANHGTGPVCVALCIDAEAIDRLGPVLRHLVVGLVDQAIHVKLLGSDHRLQRLALGPVQTHIHPPLHWPTANKRIDAIIGALSSQPPTVIHAMSAPSYGIGQTLADALDADTVLYVSSQQDCHGVGRLEPTQIGGVIVTGDALVRVLADQLKIAADRVHLVRPGVLAGQQTACFGDQERQTTVLCTAPLIKGAGIEVLIEALHLLHKRGHPTLAFLMGAGRKESSLRSLIRERGLTSHVSIVNPIGGVAAAMKHADIFVQPSPGTAFLADGLQAMASGIAVVAMPNPVSDFLRHGETCLLYEKQTPEALATVLERLLADKPFARQLAENGLSYVRECHAMSTMAEQTAEVYEQLALARATFPISE